MTKCVGLSLFWCLLSFGMLQAMETDTKKSRLEAIKPYLTMDNYLIGIQVYNQADSKKMVKRECSFYNLSGVGYFYQGTVGEALDILSAEILADYLEESNNGSKRYDLEDIMSFYIYKQGLTIKMAIMKPNYPNTLALEMFGEIASNTSVKTLEVILKKYNSEKLKNNRIFQAQEGLNEVKTITMQNLEELLKRGDNLSELQERTKVLAEDAEDLRINAKKMNSCCWLF